MPLNCFDKMVLPVLTYGSEIWGTKYAGPIEAAHRKYCKYILKVSSNTCNVAVLGELGRHNLYVHYFCKSVRFWLFIVQDNAPRLRNSLYRMLKGLDDVNRHTWASEIKQLLCVYGFRHVWLNQGVGDNSLFIETFKQRLMDTSSQDWHSDVLNSRKLELYSTYKSQLSFEVYLTVDMYYKHKIAYCRFRCVNHNLAIEKLRPTHDRADRICQYCHDNGINIIEDKFHFILICPLYKHERSFYIQKYFTYPHQAVLISLLSSNCHSKIKRSCRFYISCY